MDGIYLYIVFDVNVFFLYLFKVITLMHRVVNLQVVRKLLEPLITPDTFSEQPVTELHKLCQKSGKEIKFLTRQNVNTTTVEVLVDCVKISDESAEQLSIANLNAARSALEKLCGEKSYLLKPQHKKVAEEEKAKQKLNVLCAKMHWPLPVYRYAYVFHLFMIIGTLIFSIIYFVCNAYMHYGH